ncbi:MAG: asparagine synthase (glutamine-hydrolyzing) [Thalassospira sp.]|uniref:asparagine synthase (glutamine-hydrolyzing) n=1 Tax=unclassified Thalassospira TaxID=2648997 RepID=UPI000C41CFB7|nr:MULTISPECIES: asparagine synthase (glutamine-hydrolyzing) [unclassified Thalassospira]MBE70892.1 asparagine synthase (glutamine-hydrolyzing) [Thalassospira sp.]QPO12594.1 asparagine synthase (glutamine-hydrolyzing) [Thalassospira sp. A40-3]
MCGIAGFMGRGSRSDIHAMTDALAHRGPDGEGFYFDEEKHIYLGHRRLSVRDIEGGAQPMWDASNETGIVFNGEIYNFPELRAELEALGAVFQTSHSDTEVLIHGYRHWGTDLARRLNGMFAFAIIDKIRGRLYLARDRFGEKPLFYTAKSDLFAFSSELKSLEKHSGIDGNISNFGLQKLFAYGYIPAPNSLLENVFKLPAGQQMTVELDTLDTKISKYWEFLITPDDNLTAAKDDELAEHLQELILQSVSRRLVSDVPLGVFLSGGVDSSAILCAAAKNAKDRKVSSFTIGFEEASYDESGYAQLVAEHAGSIHHLRMLNLANAQELIPEVLGQLDEPIGDASLLPTYLLSKFTRENVTVALSGDGADELFAGYDPFLALKPAQAYKKYVPDLAHKLFTGLANALPKSGRNMSFDFKLRRTLAGLSYQESVWAPVWMAPLFPDQMKEFFEEPLPLEDLYSEAMEIWDSNSAVDRTDRLLTFFTNLYLQNDILTKVDRASMMSSLETRAIFLDNDIVDFCIKLPSHFKIRNGQRKYLLKKALEPLLPSQTINRKKKGFGIPLADWMRKTPEVQSPRPVPGVDMYYAASQWTEHHSGKSDNRFFLWNWLALQNSPTGRF